MADTNIPILSVIVTTSQRLPELLIKDGQMIFVQNKNKIALDFNGKRKFYNHIEVLETDNDRQSLIDPIEGSFYFVIGTAILWYYHDNKWIPVTSSPKDIVFIGTELPEIGSENTLYANKKEKNISVWNEEIKAYEIIADVTNDITKEDVDTLFAK